MTEEMSLPLVSVCMATHNGARFIEEQLTSILDQLTSNDEAIVVDDASTDDTPDRVEKLGDARIRLLRLPTNVGYVRAFERALNLARGDHVFLADQDDVWPLGRVALMQQALGSAAVVAGNVALLNGPDHIRGPFGERDWRLRSGHERRRLRNAVRLAASDLPYYGSAMAVRRDALEVALPFPPSVRELHDAWLVLVAMGLNSLGHVDERVVLRRVHDGNATGSIRSPREILRGRWWFLQMAWDAYQRTHQLRPNPDSRFRA